MSSRKSVLDAGPERFTTEAQGIKASESFAERPAKTLASETVGPGFDVAKVAKELDTKISKELDKSLASETTKAVALETKAISDGPQKLLKEVKEKDIKEGIKDSNETKEQETLPTPVGTPTPVGGVTEPPVRPLATLLPERVQPGDLITADLFNALLDALEELGVSGGFVRLRLGPLAADTHTLVALGTGNEAGGGIWLNGQSLLQGDPLPGITLAVLTPTLGLRFALNYDTGNNPAHSLRLAQDLASVAPGDLVAGITHGTYLDQLSQPARNALAMVGAAAVGEPRGGRPNAAFLGVVPADSTGVSFNHLVSVLPSEASGVPVAQTFVWGVYSRPLGRFLLGSGAAGGVGAISAPPSTPSLVVQALQLDPATVVRPNGVTGRVTLSDVAPTGGVAVTLSSSDPQIASVSASVTVPPGERTVQFSVTPLRGGAADILAAVGDTPQRGARLTVQEPVGVQSVAVDPRTVARPGSSTGTVRLTGPAPTGGLTVRLSSRNANVAVVPTEVAVLEGQSSAQFQVTTTFQAGDAAIDASVPGTSPQSATLTVQEAQAVGVQSLTIDPDTVQRPNNATGTVRLSGNAPTGVTVAISSSPSGVVDVPASAQVLQGQNSVQFTVRTLSAGTATVSAALGGGAPQSAKLTVQEPVSLASVSLDPKSVVVGTSVAGTVLLSAAAPAGGTTVQLESSNATVGSVPASTQVPQGSTSATFTVRTSQVGQVTVTARLEGSPARTDTLTVNPKPKETKDDKEKDTKEVKDKDTKENRKESSDKLQIEKPVFKDELGREPVLLQPSGGVTTLTRSAGPVGSLALNGVGDMDGAADPAGDATEPGAVTPGTGLSRAFIRPEERPDVGGRLLAEAGEPG